MIEFGMATPTGTFRQRAPPLVPTGNKTLGVITDNGEFITRDYLNAMHVVSFGNSVDPAATPVLPRDKPIYYKPDRNSNIYIDLQQFGFAPESINGIWIADIGNLSEVYTAWIQPRPRGPTFFDPISMTDKELVNLDPISNSDLRTFAWIHENTVPKEMNDVSGAYASIKGTVEAGAVRKQNKMIGKTLGDTMIVASAMSHFLRYDNDPANPPRIPNPFHGAGQVAGWKNYMSADPASYYDGEVPISIAVKTGDLLNAVRAILKDVPTIFEQLEAGDMPRHFKFYPSTPDAGSIVDQLPRLYERLVQDVQDRYTNLIEKFEETIEGDVLKSGYSRFQVPDSRAYTFFSDRDPERAAKRTTAGGFIRRIVVQLGVLRDSTVGYFRARIAEMPPTIDRYNEDIRSMLEMCPQTDEVVRYREGAEILMKLIVPIQRGPRPYEIHLYSLFKFVNEGNEPFRRAFLNRFPLPGAGGARAPMQGGAREEYTALLNDYVTMLTPPDGAGGAPVAKVQLNLETLNAIDENHNPFLLPANSIPLTCAFIRYNNPVTPAESLNRLHRLYTHNNNGYIMDNFMLELFEREFERLQNMQAIQIEDGRAPPPTRIDILRFNAFTAHVNSENAKMVNGADNIEFNVLERGFRNAVPPEPVPAPVPAPAPAEAVPTPVPAEAVSAPVPAEAVSAPAPAPAPASASDDEDGGAARLVVDATLMRDDASAFTPTDSDGLSVRPVDGVALTPGQPQPSGSAPPTMRNDPQPARAVGDASAVGQRLFGTPGGNRTPRRRKNRKSTYRLKKKPSK
jgi:hypothetical protein